jgi:hypothetical protein
MSKVAAAAPAIDISVRGVCFAALFMRGRSKDFLLDIIIVWVLRLIAVSRTEYINLHHVPINLIAIAGRSFET